MGGFAAGGEPACLEQSEELLDPCCGERLHLCDNKATSAQMPQRWLQGRA